MFASFAPLPPEAAEPEFTAMYDLWRAKLRDGRLPSRADFDPTELPPTILKHMLLFEVERQRGRIRFKFRLAATGFIELVGREVTGMYFDEFGPPDRTGPVASALEEIALTGRPVFLASRLTQVNEDYYYVKILGLPLAQDGVIVDMILASFLPRTRAETGGVADTPFDTRSEPLDELRCVL